MTFYNVISAILFIASFRELIRAVDILHVPQILMAGCLTALVFNDMLSTSHLVESERSVDYNWKLMLLDLLNFVLLALALIALNPTDNLFNLKLQRLGTVLSEAWFWGLLGSYWILLIVWSLVANTLALTGSRRALMSVFVATAFLAECLLVALGAAPWLVSTGRVLVSLYLAVFFVSRVLP